MPSAPARSARVLSLNQAVQTALAHQPRLRQAQASSRAAEARSDQALAPMLPQLTASASYQRITGSARSDQTATGGSGVTSVNSFNFGVSARQLVYDFGQARGRWRAAQANADVQRQSSEATRLEVTLAVKNSYFQARAQSALVDVARETLANQQHHLAQIEGFVEVGTRPRIDLVQARADRARAELNLVNAENGYAIAKAGLAQAIGAEAAADFEVSDEALPEIPGEDAASAQLLSQALATRPDVQAAVGTVRAQELSAKALQGAYGPTLSVATSLSEGGQELDNMRWNWVAGAELVWPIFQGGVTQAQVAEARANIDVTNAQVSALRQQVLFEVEQARLGIRSAKKAIVTAEQLVENSRERLLLAEGRYQAGTGSIIELGDAQLALTAAQGERVQAEYSLATARAALLNALGRP
jgi:outer membrane protein